MGLSFQRSVKFGPLRFNFSGSGIGVSAGVPGFRVGTGPRGAYVSAGVGGFRYRQSLGATRNPTAPSRRAPAAEPAPDVIARHSYEEPNALVFSHASSDSLLDMLNEQANKPFYSHWVMAGALAVAIAAFTVFHGNAALVATVATAVVGVALSTWASRRDALRRLTVLFYEPDEPTQRAFGKLQATAASAADVRRLQLVTQSATYADGRRNAGASYGLSFGQATFRVGQVSSILANIPVPILTAGTTTLGFYPDRILVFSRGYINAITYRDLIVDSIHETFIENGIVPTDATVIGHTWRYVNNNGSPDKRFNNNSQIPELALNRFELRTQKGMHLRFSASRRHAFDEFADSLRAMAAIAAAPAAPRFETPSLAASADPAISLPSGVESPEGVIATTDGRRIANW